MALSSTPSTAVSSTTKRMTGLMGFVPSQVSVKIVQDHGKYLGCPSSLSRNKKASLSYITNKVQKVLQGWKEKLFSTAGKEVLIKAVAQAIPTYTLTCFKLPQGCCHDLNRLMANFWWGSSEQGKKIHWLKWEVMTKPKDRGGMGFRDIKLFNQALLAKHTWRLLNRPQSLMAQILKARYYPHDEFLKAKMGGRPSYVWRGIIWGRELAVKGGRWRVGNGESIDIYDDQWIPRPKTFRLFSPQRPLTDRRVKSLFAGNQSWNIPLLTDLFLQDDVNKIQDIPIAGDSHPDTFFWHHDKKGKYTVRSGYKLAVDDLHEASSSAEPSNLSWWKALWMLNLPNKLKVFVWRASLNILPTMMNLANRHISNDPRCPLCGKENETMIHALWFCKKVKKHWARWSPVQHLLNSHYVDALDLFCRCQETLTTDDLEIFAAITWSMWTRRNKYAFQGNRSYIQQDYDSVEWASAYISEYKEVQAKHHRDHRVNERSRDDDDPSLTAWIPPPQNQFKLNVDAALANGDMGSGIIIRNSSGETMASAEYFRRTSCSVEWTEAQALVDGVQLAVDSGLSPVWAETDSKIVWKLLHDRDNYQNEIAPLIHCLKLLAIDNHIRGFLLTKREGNKAAHQLAIHARTTKHSEVWLEDNPPWTHSIVAQDMPQMATPTFSFVSL